MSAWVLENIAQIKGKAAPWVKEDKGAVLGQLRWLNHVLRQENNVTLLVTHDDALFTGLVKSGHDRRRAQTLTKSAQKMGGNNGQPWRKR